MSWIDELELTPRRLGELSPALWGEIAAFLVRWGYYADALEPLRRLSAERPDSAAVGAWLVEALIGSGASAEALQLADALAAARAGEPTVLAARASALLAGGRAPEAVSAARSLLDAGAAQRPLALQCLARCRLVAGDLPGALAAAEQSLALTPSGNPTAPVLRLLNQILRRQPESKARLAEVREEMIRAHREELEWLKHLVRRQASSPADPGERVPSSPGPLSRSAGEGELPSGVAAAGGTATGGGPPCAGLTTGVLPGSAGARPGTGERDPAPAGKGEGAPKEGVRGFPDLRAELQRVFGHEEFRPGQREVVERVLAGESVLSVMPTGAGKSLCYQLPAALLPRTTVVISPLIALMKDQVEALPPVLGEQATLINSALSPQEVEQRLRETAAGRYRLVYAAPERLRQWPFLDALRRAGLSLFVIDEAHCLSLWGHDFRPDYLFLGPVLRRLGSPPVLAMTATATPTVYREIGERLGRKLRVISLGVFRPNLRLEVVHAGTDEEKLGLLAGLCRGESGAAVVYASSRERCEDLARMLRRQSVQAQHYHAGMATAERAGVQDAFMSGRVRVIVATVAFGMGVDKRDVRLVVHYNLPRSVESYYQEAGRAGRDGLPSRCVLLSTPGDRANLTRWMGQERLPMQVLRDSYRAVRVLAGSRRVARVSVEELARSVGCEDQTQVRVALSLLERVGLLARDLDVPRVLTLTLRAWGDDPLLRAVAGAAGLQPGRSATVDPLPLALAVGTPPGELEGAVLGWQSQGWVECRTIGRDLFLEVPAPPPDARAALDRLLTEHEQQQRKRLDRMFGYVKTRGCRHGYIAEQFGEAPPAHCRACDNCLPGKATGDGRRGAGLAGGKAASPTAPKGAAAVRRGTAGPGLLREAARPAQSARDLPESPGLVVLQCLAELPFSVGKKGLVNILRGSLVASIGADRCRQHGMLAGLSRARIERLAERLVERGYLARDASDERPLLRLTASGRLAAAQGALPEKIDV